MNKQMTQSNDLSSYERFAYIEPGPCGRRENKKSNHATLQTGAPSVSTPGSFGTPSLRRGDGCGRENYGKSLYTLSRMYRDAANVSRPRGPSHKDTVWPGPKIWMFVRAVNVFDDL